MARLKKTITIEKGTVDSLKRAETVAASAPTSDSSGGPGAPMMMSK